MIEIHSKIHCKKCGHSFHAMYVNTGALPSKLTQTVQCPFCSAETSYAYKFSAEFPCTPKRWQFWKSKMHFIADHCSFNEGTMNPELYPRKCICGKEILLEQKRVM